MLYKTNIKHDRSSFVSDNEEDLERLRLLDIIFLKGIHGISRIELERLQYLLEKKDYSHDAKAQKSKTKLLKKISVAIYDYDEKHGNSFKTS
jgi:intein-encoded DNA endonuclease-like protein